MHREAPLRRFLEAAPFFRYVSTSFAYLPAFCCFHGLQETSCGHEAKSQSMQSEVCEG